MKTSLAAAILFSNALAIHAQSLGTTVNSATNSTPWTVVSCDANSRVWQQTNWTQDVSGELVPQVHSYTELQTGLYFLTNGTWAESKEEIDVVPGGGAQAIQGQHQVYFPSDIYSGVIETVTGSGQQLKSRPLGICYFDGTNSVLIAELTNSVGQLISANQVIYTNAFTDFPADLLTTYRKSGLECDLVFRSQIPAPEVFGLSSAGCRLELLTEFFDTQDPQAIPASVNPVNGLSDSTLTFGSMAMVHGKAFRINGSQGLSGGVSVSKTWAHLDGRTFLIEEVPYSEIRPSLQMLPALGPGANTNVSMQAASKTPSSVARASTGGPVLAGPKAVSGESVLHKVSTSRLLPPRRIAQSTTNTMRLAKADIASKAGVVWDYNFVNSQSNMTFRGDTTYYVSNNVNLSGTTTIEGGAVIKYDTNYNCSINILGTINCETGPYRPAILTSANDLSVGEAVTVGPSQNNNSGCIGNFQILEVDNNTWFDGPSSGLSIYIYEYNNLDDYEYEDYMPANTTNYYVLPAQEWQFYAVDSYSDEWNLDFSPTEQNGDLQVWGFNADSEPGYYQSGPSLCMPILPVTALTLANGGSLHDLFIRNVGTGIESSGNFSVTNIQFVQVQDAALDAEGVSLYAGNVLMSQVGIGFGGKNFNVESEQLTFDQGSDLAYDWGEADYGSSSSVALTNALITSVLSLGDTTLYTNDVIVPAAGSFAYQSVGAGNYYLSGAYAGASVSPGLQAQLQQKTTYPPTLYSNSVAQGNTTLGPQVTRNDGAIGYHYDPIDYLVDYFWITNGTLILTNGVVLAGYNDQDILVTDGGSIISMGTPLVPNWLTRYSCVQEQPLGLGAYATNPVSAYMVNPWHVSTAPTGIFRFTKFSSPAAGGYHLLHTGLNNSFTNLLVQDCEFWSATNDFSGFTNTATVLKNNLFARSGINAVGSAHTNNSLAVSNNLFWNMGMNIHTGQNSNAWYFFNNDFDNCSLTFGVSSQLSVNGYNAYLINTNRLKPTNACDIVTTNDIAYQTGPLGIFYQTTNSILTNAGSCTGGAAGLYHYTTATNEVPEANSTVDIGYHYVALDTNGNPLCFTGDGIPDYVADSNGNGVYDPGIDYADWLLGIVIQPQSQNVVQGANATFSVVAGGTTPFSYQWMFNGANISGATSSSLTLLVVTTNNEGNYSVVVTNSSGGAVTSSVASLTVNVPLQITSEPVSQTVIQGSNVSFGVSISGNYPSYQWLRNGVNAYGGEIDGATGSTDTFYRVTGSSAGNYTVVVANLFNSVTSSPPAVLTVITNPGVSTQPGNVTNIQGNDVALSVTAGGTGLNYQWWLTNSLGTNAIPGATNATYRRLAVQTNDAGAYGVIVTNLAGSTNAKGTLTVMVPPWFTNQPASVTNALGGNATFSVGAFGTTNLSYQWFKNSTNVSGATNSSLTLTNIQISDAAGYFLVASNIAGTNATAWAWLCVVSNGTTYNGWGSNSQPPTNTPVVSMISPTNTQATNPAIFLYGTNISIHASATSAYDYITNVAFYTNAATSTNLLGSAVRGSNAMFAFGWTTALHGTNVLLAVAADNLGLSATSSNVYVVMDAPPTNSAGPSQTLVWHTNIQSTNLTMAGVVSDDGLPFGVTNVLWSVVASNGSVSFSSLTNTNPTVTFTNYGTYDLRLWADDGFVTNYSDCTITWLHPPVVSIISPTNGSQFLVGTSIVLSANAYGLNTTVTNVQFYNGSNSLGIAVPSTGNMYNFDWTNAPLWTNGVTAVAEDNHGLYATSMVTTVVVVPPLAAWIISPTNGQLFVDSPTNIVLTAQVLSFVNSSNFNVSFSNGLVNLGSATNAGGQNWQLSTWGATNGTYTVTVIASDNAGNTTNNSIAITVNAMPLISITSPTNLSSFLAVANVTNYVTAWDRDRDGSITNVAFYGLRTNFQFPITTNAVTNYPFTWTNLAVGNYPVTAVATDNRGASSVSQIVVFKVTNSDIPPSVVITYPTNTESFPDAADITITASVTPGSESVTNVEFFVDGQSIGSDPNAPYEISKCCWKPGNYTIAAVATDSNGITSASTNINITIQPDPIGTGGFWDPVYSAATEDGYVIPPDYTNEASLAYGGTGYAIAAVPNDGELFATGGEFGNADTEAIIRSTNTYYWFGASLDGHGAYGLYNADTMWALAVEGTNVYVGGWVESSPSNYVAKWNGSDWTPVGDQFNSDNTYAYFDGSVWSLTVIGGQLYAGGGFYSTGTVGGGNTNTARIARLDPISNTWAPVGSPINNGIVYAIAAVGSHIYIGGSFTNVGGNSNINYIAELVGNTWTNVGLGVSGTNGIDGSVMCMAACDTNLFVGGFFTTAGTDASVNGVAVWNGMNWKSLGGGAVAMPADLTYDKGNPYPLQYGTNSTAFSPRVLALAVHGDTVYIGGTFKQVYNGSSIVDSEGVAMAQWSEASQTWTWSGLDGGVCDSPDDSGGNGVNALLIVQNRTNNAYDLYVAGSFFYAGSEDYPTAQLARWRIGYPPSPSLPVIIITNPPNETIYSNRPSSIEIDATATNVLSVQFFVDGHSIGNDNSTSGNSYGITWTPTVGPHVFTAVATNSSGLAGKSKPVVIYITDTNNTVTATDDVYVLLANGPPATLNVLTNDSTTSGHPLHVVEVFQGNTSPRLGTATVSPDGKSILYTISRNSYGTDQFTYWVSDGVSTNQAYVTVNVRAQPIVAFKDPFDGSTNDAGANVTVDGAMVSYDSTLTNFSVYVNGTLLTNYVPSNLNYLLNPTNFFFDFPLSGVGPQTSYAYFSMPWSTNTPGFYTFTASAVDAYGISNFYTFTGSAVGDDGIANVSTPVTLTITNSSTATNSLTAIINNLASSGTALGTVNYTTVTNGFFDLRGTAWDSNTNDPVSYQILVHPFDNDTPVLANVTPPPLDAMGFHDGRVNNGDLGTSDFSTLPNGVYDLELIVRGGGGQTNTIAAFQLQSNLKIGQFSFSEQDLTLPVNGIPLTVTRTYNSLNPDSGPFGTSWSFALNDMDVQLDDQRQDVTIDQNAYLEDGDDSGSGSGLPQTVNMRTGGNWDVTLTMPNGQRVTFPFHYYQSGFSFYAFWDTPPGVKATLEMRGNNNFNVAADGITPEWADADLGLGNGPAPFQYSDIEGWVLTTLPDNTKYYIMRGPATNVVTADPADLNDEISARVYGPPKLTMIKPISGDFIVITNTGIFHYDPANNLTRAILFDHDSQGRITALHDPNGGSNGLPAVQYVYDNDNNNLVQVLKLVDRNAGTYTTNKYRYDNPNFRHYITSVVDANGIPITVNHYDPSGLLTNSTDGNGNSITFVHNTSAQVEMVVDAMGNTNTYAYDLNGNVTNTVDGLGQQTSTTFDGDGNVTSITDPLTNTYRFTYDASGKQTSVVNPLGHTNYMAYNSFGQLTAITNVLGFATQFQYDNLGNLTNRMDALNHQLGIQYDQNNRPIAQTDALNRTNVVVSYDSAGNLATLSNLFSGSLTTYSYDSNGTRTGSSNIWVNPTNSSDVRAITNSSVFDAQGREISSTGPDGNTSRIAFNANGQQSQTTDQYNRVSGWAYDASGNMIQITHSDGTVSQMVYDNNNRLSVSDDNHSPGAVVNGTRISYDAAGQVIKSERLTNVVIIVSTLNGVLSSAVNSIGGVIATSTYGYDLAGRQIAVTNGFGGVTQYQYDSVGNQTAVIDALSNRTDYVYDAAGNLIFMTNALKGVTHYVYDELDLPIRTIYPDGSSTGVGYGIGGELLADTNELGLVTAYYYDAAEQITNIVKPSVFNPEGGTNANPQWGFVYDNYGQVASISNPKYRVTKFNYDQLGRPQTRTLPMGQTASQEYDSYGRIFRKVDFNGQTNEFIYDSLGRLATNQFFAFGSSTPSVLASYVYDGEDRTSQIIEPRGTNVVTYDGRGHVLQIASPEGTVNYEYEPVEGRRTRVYTTNTDLRYSYDALGRIQTVSVAKRGGVVLSPLEVTTNDYTALGSLQDIYYPDGIHALYQYDVMNRLTNLVYTNGSGQLLAQYHYAPNTNGQWKTATEIQWQSGTNFSTNQLAWFYDNLGRLFKETCGSTALGLSFTNQYVFDLLGNRLWETNVLGGTTTTTGYTYNTNDQLLVESGGTSFTNLYDANGSLTNRTSGTETNGYVFNLQNRLASATIQRTDSGHTISETIGYTYDYQGNRVRATWLRSVDGGAPVNGTNFFLIEPNAASGRHQVLEESPALGATPIVTYTLGAGVVSQQRSNVISHFLPDGHGSTRLLADTNAGIVSRFTYDAYGKPLNFTADLYTVPATTLLYSGGQYDTDLQQYNAQARYYSPVTGRFGQADPFSGKQQTGANLYTYCEDDPVNSVDPTGQYEIDVHQFLTQYLADKAGFGNAAQIGEEAQGPDALVTKKIQADGTFLDQSRSAYDGKSVNQDNMRLYHFVNQERLALMATYIGKGRWRRMGEFFHAQEDTYAHSSYPGGRNFVYYGDWLALGNGGFAGHALHGHNPDQTWRDVPKAMKMARRVFADMQGILADPQHKYPGSFVCTDEVDESIPNPKWDAIKGDVQKFVAFPPNVIMENLGFDEQVTFGGYNTKIQLLDSSYQVNVAYKNPPGPFPSDIGYRPGKFFVTKVRSIGCVLDHFIDSVGGPLSSNF